MIPLPTQLAGARFLAERKRAFLTQDYVKECLDYDPVTGVFRWKIRPLEHFNGSEFRSASHACNQWNARYAGTVAGSFNGACVSIMVDGRRYKAHRIAWCFVYGRFPDGILDHIDCDTLNNKISNLRLATVSQNGANRPKQKNNTSGFKGVRFHRGARKWNARIKVMNKEHYLGLFDTAEAAHAAYEKAAVSLLAEFARVS